VAPTSPSRPAPGLHRGRAAGEHLTGARYAAAFAGALGEPVDYRPLTQEEFRSLGLRAGDEFGNMLQFYVECERLDPVRSLNPAYKRFAAG
jgi:hypothetical protein